MFEIFQEEPVISGGIIGFLVFSVLVRLLLGAMYGNMIKEADNMAATNNKLLKQCKLKFAHCYQLNNGVANIPIFVDKFLNRLALGPFSFDTLYHLSGQCMLLSVICSGIGVCRYIVEGKSFGELLPFYILSFIGLYLYFSVSTVVDIKGRKRVLKVNLVDYLENHLSARIDVTESDIEMLYGEEIPLRGRQMRLASGDGGQMGLGMSGRRMGLTSKGGRSSMDLAGHGRSGRRTVELMPIGNRVIAEPMEAAVVGADDSAGATAMAGAAGMAGPVGMVGVAGMSGSAGMTGVSTMSGAVAMSGIAGAMASGDVAGSADGEGMVAFPRASGQETMNYKNFQITEEELEALIKEFC